MRIMPSESHINILLVDDKPDKLAALESVLTDLGANIVTAPSGKEALRLLLKYDFAVILLDVNMPIMDGFETATLIRERKKSEHTPIIFVTALSTSENHIYRGYSLGAVDFIFTPVVPGVLRAKVSVFVELLKKTEEIKRQAAELRQAEEREHHRSLQDARERLEIQTVRNRFFVLAVDMLGIASFDGFFTQLNPSWERVLGYKEEELKTPPWIEFVHPDDQALTIAHLEELRAGAASAYFENRFCSKRGEYHWLGWTIAPFVAEKTFYLFARDITERKRVEQALQETNTELESFSYTVSHDLRAPLRAMQGFADALLQDYAPKLDATAQDFAQRIVTSARRMDALIQDLLLYSRLNRNELKLDPIDLQAVINEALAQLENEIQRKHAHVTIEKPLPPACGHYATLVQVVANLINNAVKFVGEGVQPEIHVRGEKNGKFMKLFVADNGIGIPPEYHGRIFRVFERLHGSAAYPGTGIGLAIVRKGMERMGGRVGLKSVPNHGSEFWIELPLPGAC
jgi:PAS domain S-box-containing protein